MPVQFAGGTIANSTYTGSTRNAIVEGARTALLSAGWLDVSGSSGDRTLDSAVTPQGLSTRVRFFDPASNSAQVTFMNGTGTLTSQAFFLSSGVGKLFNVIADQYQFFVSVPQSILPSDFVAGGSPFLETFLTTGPNAITTAIWAQGNTRSSTIVSGTPMETYRTRCGPRLQYCWSVLNTNTMTASNESGVGSQRLIAVVRSYDDINADSLQTTQWHDDYSVKIPARICWGLSAFTDTGKIRGQLWDAYVIMHDFPIDLASTFDGHDWKNITSSNTTDRGHPSLFIAVT